MPDGLPDTITFSSGAAPFLAANLAAVAEGTYVVISKDNITGPAADQGIMNGRIYRVGNNVSGDTWELAPGNDFTPDPGVNGTLGAAGSRESDDICAIGTNNAEGTNVTFSGPADAYIIGRGLKTDLTGYEGPAMDIAAYTGFIPVK